jgi:hypothetical protein
MWIISYMADYAAVDRLREHLRGKLQLWMVNCRTAISRFHPLQTIHQSTQYYAHTSSVI